MRLHHLVPAALALAISAQAADLPVGTDVKTPLISIGGFVDTALVYTQGHKTGQDPTTYKSEERGGLSFWADAELRVGWKPNEKVKGQMDIEVHNNAQKHRHSTAVGADGVANTSDDTYTEANSGSEGVIVDLEQAYFTWEFQPGLYWTMGKFTNCIGFVAADAPDLYRVNQGLIFGVGPFSWYGNYGLYGGDWVGTTLVYEKDDISAGAYLFNSATSEPYNGDRPQSNRENTDLGFALDATFKLKGMGDKSYVNAEFVYDSAGAGNAPSAGLQGDLYQFGLNSLLQPTAELKLGFEAIYGFTTAAHGANRDLVAGTKEHLGLMVMTNYTISDSMSATFMATHVDRSFRCDDTDSPTVAANELAVALLTTPAGTPNFGLNFEVSYAWQEGDGTKTGQKRRADDGDWGVAVEGLVIIP